MLEWFGTEADDIRIAFSKVFGSRWRPFGSAALHVGGFSDGREGVQWNVAYDPRDGRQWVAVNLEGMQYGDWPIARFIETELKEPDLPVLTKKHRDLAGVLALWRRDYWQATSRPEIEEKDIAPTPIPLGKLTPEQWRMALLEARNCLDSRRKRRGRATQTVTLRSGEQVTGEVSPHLAFRYMAPGRMPWEALFREARTCLQPLHEWTVRRSSLPIRF